MSNPDLIEEYGPEDEPSRRVCEHFLEGQEFMVEMEGRLCISVLVFGCNLFGEGPRDVMDPRLRMR